MAVTGSVHPVLIATRSAGKLREIRPILAAAGFATIDLETAGIPESVEEGAVEAFATFEENALAKARHFHHLSGLLTVADDSGLEVEALGGAPGVFSKRWSGAGGLDAATVDAATLDAANNAHLMQRLAGMTNRSARFVCVAAAFGDGVEETARGEVRGAVALSVRGSGGFGYDPCFIPAEGDGRTFAEQLPYVKARLSHRARAFAALVRALSMHA